MGAKGKTQVSLRIGADVRRELEEVCELLGHPWTLSSVITKSFQLFIADGAAMAAERISRGSLWAPAATPDDPNEPTEEDMAWARAVLKRAGLEPGGQKPSEGSKSRAS